MPLRGVLPPRELNEEQDPPAPQAPYEEVVTNAKFYTAFTLLAWAMISQANQVVIALLNAPTLASKVRDFMRLNPAKFNGSKVDEDT